MVALILLTVLGTVLLHFEGLRFLSPVSTTPLPLTRYLVLQSVFGVLGVHVLEIALYAVIYWVGDIVLDVGSFMGPGATDPLKYVYFSFESFTALGMGDVYPVGALRLVAGAEALNGLLLIAWSASFTFLLVQRSWEK